MKEILKIHHLINVGEVYLKFMKQTMFLIFCYNFTCVKGTAMNSLICKKFIFERAQNLFWTNQPTVNWLCE